MRQILLPVLILFFNVAHSQNVGIGTSSPGAILDVSATNNGILIPRVALTGTGSASPLTSPATSTMVYNTATVTNVTPGYYYWSGAAWIRLIDNASIGGATTVSNTSSANTLSTTVNGVTGTGVNIINSNALSQNGSNQLISTINGIGSTAYTVGITGDVTGNLGASTVAKIQGIGVAFSSLATNNLLQYNGTNWVNVTPTAATSHTLSLTGNTLTSTVNGVAPTQLLSGLSLAGDVTGTLASSTVAKIQGTGVAISSLASSNLLQYNGTNWVNVTPASVLNAATTHTLSLSGNTLTSTVNGIAATSSAVSGVSNTSSSNTLSTTVNGVTGSTVLIINTNALGLSGTSVTSTVNGVASTPLDISSIDKNIYNSDGTLTGTRTVTMGGNTLNFTGGNVGIGATGPTVKLQVAGDIQTANQIRATGWLTGTAAGQGAEIGVSGGVSYLLSYDRTAAAYMPLTAAGSTILLSHSNTTNDLYINSSGNVGIGNNSPATKLSVTGDVLRTNTRVSNSQSYPLGHGGTGENLFEIDPTWTNAELQSYFNSASVSWYADATAPAGYCIQISGGANVAGPYNSGFPFIPIDASATYYMECWIRSSSASVGHYMGSADYDQNFSCVGGNPGSYGYWVMSNTLPGTSWVKVSGYISGTGSSVGQFKTGAVYWTPMALFNYTSGGGATTYISGWKVVKTSALQASTTTAYDGSLIVNSGTATTLATNTVTLPQGVYFITPYNCISSVSNNSYIQFNAVATAGTISSGFVNWLFNQMNTYSTTPFIVKVISSTATLKFQVVQMAGGTITNPAANCLQFFYTKIN